MSDMDDASDKIGGLEATIFKRDGEIKLLKGKLEETEHARAEEAARNKILCEEVHGWSERAKQAEADRNKECNFREAAEKSWSEWQKEVEALKRKLAETEKAGEVIRQRNSELIMERLPNFKEGYSTLMAAIGMTETDDLAGGLDVIKQLVSENKTMKLGLGGIEVNADSRLRPRDKTTIARDGRDWTTFSLHYHELLDLCCTYGMIVVVLP